MKQVLKSPSCWLLALSMLFLGGMGAGYWIQEEKTVSASERRVLKTLSAPSIQSVLFGDFQAGLEDVLLDQLPGRDLFLKADSLASRWIFGNLDDNGLILYDGHLIRIEDTLNENSLQYAADVMASVYTRYLASTDCSIYLSIIPDSYYFVTDPTYVRMDYEELLLQVREQADFAEYIDLLDTLDLSDYYTTDSHWKQTEIVDTARKLADSLGITLEENWYREVLLDSFSGVYGSQSAWGEASEPLEVLVPEGMEDWTVTTWQSGKPEQIPVYDRSKLDGMDPYEVFLSGNAGLITLENPDAGNERELVIFRDSFASPLAVLLASGYSKVTLIDLRSLPVSQIGNYVEFTDQDVLFLYSTSVLNSSFSLHL